MYYSVLLIYTAKYKLSKVNHYFKKYKYKTLLHTLLHTLLQQYKLLLYGTDN